MAPAHTQAAKRNNVNPELVLHQKAQKIFDRFEVTNSPPNKETSRPEDNYDYLYEEILDHEITLLLLNNKIIHSPSRRGIFIWGDWWIMNDELWGGYFWTFWMRFRGPLTSIMKGISANLLGQLDFTWKVERIDCFCEAWRWPARWRPHSSTRVYLTCISLLASN